MSRKGPETDVRHRGGFEISYILFGDELGTFALVKVSHVLWGTLVKT